MIVIPTPAPVICVPASVSIPVDQETVVSCTAAGFSGQITATVANPVIASVDLAPGTLTLFYVEGHEAGSTTATFLTQPGGTGQLPIVVTANSP